MDNLKVGVLLLIFLNIVVSLFLSNWSGALGWTVALINAHALYKLEGEK